jgi:signal transduction histidine kinase
MNFITTQKVTESDSSKLVKQAAHDIRSPLSVLNLIAASEQVSMCEESRALVQAAVKRINDIATELLMTQTLVKKNDKVSMKNLIDGIVSEKRILAATKKVQFKVIYKGAQDLALPDMGGQFERALSNIIDNALEAIAHESGKIVIMITQKLGKIFLRITDNGKGIPKAILTKIGSEGFSFGKKGKKTSGFGLGVFQAKSLAESIGGALKLYSAEGRGTSVLMKLPVSV